MEISLGDFPGKVFLYKLFSPRSSESFKFSSKKIAQNYTKFLLIRPTIRLGKA
jgi:hypothetical protein